MLNTDSVCILTSNVYSGFLLFFLLVSVFPEKTPFNVDNVRVAKILVRFISLMDAL